MIVAGAVTQGSGAVNEDGFGVIAEAGEVSAAWVFDGVTGINGRNYLPGGSDAAWLVARAGVHLHRLARAELPLAAILEELVLSLIADWQSVTAQIPLPGGYDPPAACLILARKYRHGWKALRLGDSCLLARPAAGKPYVLAASPHTEFDQWLAQVARTRRDLGEFDIKTLIREFHPQLIARRLARNRPGGYAILEADMAALAMPEFIELANPAEVLLCTDGFYRAVDHYRIYDDVALLSACAGKDGVEQVLALLRAAEADDPQCRKFLRFKPADDATAVMLVNGT